MTDDSVARPPLPDDAGINTIRLDLALTRDELAVTAEQLRAKLDPRRLVNGNPTGTLAVVLTMIAVVGSIAVHVAERRSRERSRDV